MFAVVDANLNILSGIFTVSFLIMMGLFAISNLLLKVNRDRLVRKPRTGLPIVLVALVIVFAAIAGNITMSPVIVGYFSAFFVVAFLAMTYTGYRGRLVMVLYWIYTRSIRLHSYPWTRNWHVKLIQIIKKRKEQPIIFFAKTDEV